jgi:hypothetical protein
VALDDSLTRGYISAAPLGLTIRLAMLAIVFAKVIVKARKRFYFLEWLLILFPWHNAESFL